MTSSQMLEKDNKRGVDNDGTIGPPRLVGEGWIRGPVC